MLLHYKCPNCGDDMTYDTESGSLSCSSCGHQENIETYDDAYIEQVFADDEEVKEYHCENCGAIVITDADTTATSCSFCEAAVVLGDRLTGKLAPKKVIPFKINKQQAQEAFVKWCRKGILTPRGFMTANRIENITGMYVPFWIYDINSKVEFRGTGTKVRTYSRGDYIYTETKYYDIYRKLDLYYSRVPADASEKMADDIMDKLEPYHYNDLETFKTPYLVGYLAEKYNYDDKDLFPRVKGRVRKFAQTYTKSTMPGYATITTKNEDINTKNLRAQYALFPVWMVYYNLDKQQHTFAMNGQTGKVVGKPPISKRKVAYWFSGISVGAFAVIKSVAFAVSGVFW
ncbi:MAG TPA: TFIIB-type zinc ribbon-containing protein [Candidatus Pseudogracilibacillus intestinigallinarum]|uniref:TFIIB-type zinc ribbon-containing protein n=1 Tax=Candidatus Pseudogracilibacillus intestinigallinarum TaxID=2838742 RepID=A0A9D1PK63_9BACI|nr:TFIIB-type zinc ribbon-containing protein [Candidatus Pseudogracilibacillus intestinigallinarum]